jgi:four helix bundle protein
MIERFQDPEVWQMAHKAALEIVSPLRQAAYSIPANLAEGYGRRSTKEFLQFLTFANCCAEELHCFVILSKDSRHISMQDEARLTGEITGIVPMLAALKRSSSLRASELGTRHSSPVAGDGSRDTRPPAEVRN